MAHAKWLALPLALAASGCAAHLEAATPPPAPVAVEAARRVPATPVFAGPGTVAPAHVYRIGFEISGRVARVTADVGDRVGAGTVLAALDTSDYGAQARAAAARAAEADASFAKAQAGARPQERDSARQSVEAAHAELERASAAERLSRQNLNRSQALLSDGSISVQANDAAVAAERDALGRVGAARAQLSSAVAQASLVDAGPRLEDRDAARAAAAAAHASADLAATTLAKTSISAPAESFVQSRSIEPGSQAQPGTPAFVLADASVPDVLAAVPETALGPLHVGSVATVKVGNASFLAHVSRIEPMADPATRTAQVRLSVGGARLPLGSVVEVTIGARRAGGVSVPLGAVITDVAGTHLLCYERASGTVALRPVAVESAQGDRAVVTGVPAGTQVVVAGQHRVAAGAHVRIVSLARPAGVEDGR